MAVDPETPSTVYVIYFDATGSYQIAKSVDGGSAWQVALAGALPPPPFPGPGRSFGGLVLDPEQPSVLWLTSFVNQIPRSTRPPTAAQVGWPSTISVFFIPGHGDYAYGRRHFRGPDELFAHLHMLRGATRASRARHISY